MIGIDLSTTDGNWPTLRTPSEITVGAPFVTGAIQMETYIR